MIIIMRVINKEKTNTRQRSAAATTSAATIQYLLCLLNVRCTMHRRLCLGPMAHGQTAFFCHVQSGDLGTGGLYVGCHINQPPSSALAALAASNLQLMYSLQFARFFFPFSCRYGDQGTEYCTHFPHLAYNVQMYMPSIIQSPCSPYYVKLWNQFICSWSYWTCLCRQSVILVRTVLHTHT